jgi:hypothetical protein
MKKILFILLLLPGLLGAQTKRPIVASDLMKIVTTLRRFARVSADTWALAWDRPYPADLVKPQSVATGPDGVIYLLYFNSSSLPRIERCLPDGSALPTQTLPGSTTRGFSVDRLGRYLTMENTYNNGRITWDVVLRDPVSLSALALQPGLPMGLPNTLASDASLLVDASDRAWATFGGDSAVYRLAACDPTLWPTPTATPTATFTASASATSTVVGTPTQTPWPCSYSALAHPDNGSNTISAVVIQPLTQERYVLRMAGTWVDRFSPAGALLGSFQMVPGNTGSMGISQAGMEADGGLLLAVGWLAQYRNGSFSYPTQPSFSNLQGVQVSGSRLHEWLREDRKTTSSFRWLWPSHRPCLNRAA